MLKRLNEHKFQYFVIKNLNVLFKKKITPNCVKKRLSNESTLDRKKLKLLALNLLITWVNFYVVLTKKILLFLNIRRNICQFIKPNSLIKCINMI